MVFPRLSYPALSVWVFSGFLLCSRTAAATEWLTWSPPPECPQTEHVRNRVEEWLDGDLPGPERLTVHGEVRWTGNRWLTTVAVSLDGETRERSVQTERCADAADFVALTIVLAVDPTNQRAGDEGAEHEISMEHSDSDTPAADTKRDATRSEKDAGIQTSIVPPSPILLRPRLLLPAPNKPAPSGLLALAAEGASGTLPGVQAGVAVQGAVAWFPFQVRLGVQAFPPTTRAVAGAVAAIDFSSYAARLGACYSMLFGNFVVSPCVALEGGVILTEQQSEDSSLSRVTTPLWGLDAQAEAAYRLTGPLRIFASAGLRAPLMQTRLLLSDGQLVRSRVRLLPTDSAHRAET